MENFICLTYDIDAGNLDSLYSSTSLYLYMVAQCLCYIRYLVNREKPIHFVEYAVYIYAMHMAS